MDKQILNELVITRIISVSTIYTAEQARSRRACRPCWAIVYKWEGETEYQLKNGRIVISNARNPVILPRGCAYTWICTRAGRYSIIEFDADAAQDSVISLQIPESDQLLTAFRRLEQICTRKQAFWQLEAVSGTYQILSNLLRTVPSGSYQSSAKLEKIQPAVDYMLRHLDRTMTNDELAAMTEVSTVYFRKLFTQIFGMSPIHYLHHLRIEKAKEILQSDFGSITDVAASLGYPSIYHFSKAFKRDTGLSPTKFVRSRSEPM